MTRQPTTDPGVLEETRLKTRKPTRLKVILLNDDYTTMEFDLQLLELSLIHNSEPTRRTPI